jgi:lipid-A-disaccharide synthase
MGGLLIVAGELSGDLHAGGLLQALRRSGFDAPVWGIGGDRMRAADMDLMVHVRDMAVMGLSEVLRRFLFFRRVFRSVLARVDRDRPDLAVLVDYPGFNLRLARELHRRGIPVVYYVCPQVWAWHRSRIPQMARVIKRLLVIFPFEVDVFRSTGLDVEYVGHPLVRETDDALLEPAAPLPWSGNDRVAVLPGSRRQELERILPALNAAAVELERRRPGVSFLMASATPEMDRIAQAILARQPARPRRWAAVTGQMRQVVRQARAAWVTSGTATLETALMGCPMAVVYRASPLTYALGRRLIHVPHIGMVNLVVGRGLCPELIQNDCEPGHLASAIEPLLDDTPARTAMREGFEEIRRLLGSGHAAERAAECVLDTWRSTQAGGVIRPGG